MISSITRILNDPFPLEEDRKAQMLSNLVISILVVVIIAMVKPFGLESLPFHLAKQIPIYFGYGIITFAMLLMTDLIIKPAFPIFFDEQFWTVKKNIVWAIFVLLLIGVGNLFYSNALGFTGISGRLLLNFVIYNVAVTVLPVIVYTLINRYRLLKRNMKEVDEINEKLVVPILKKRTEYPIVFSSENEKDALKLSPDQFLFAESADSFTDIVYTENGIVRRFLIRSALKRVEEFNSSEYVTRVHRVYLANLFKVQRVTGNSQGYRLVFRDVEQTVPVSKRTSKIVKSLLTKMHSRQSI